MLLALLENVVDGIVMEWKRFCQWSVLGLILFFKPDKCNLIQLKVRETSPCSANLEVI